MAISARSRYIGDELDFALRSGERRIGVGRDILHRQGDIRAAVVGVDLRLCGGQPKREQHRGAEREKPADFHGVINPAPRRRV